jgi:hypothetical protein
MATLIPDRVWCLLGRHEALMTRHRDRGGAQLLVWVCRHCLRELGTTDISLPPVVMTPLKVERVRQMIRRTNEAARR